MGRVLHPEVGPHPVHTLHRVGASVIGVALVVFGVLGVTHGLPMFSTEGRDVLGLGSNGLLSAVSLVVGVVLVAAAARGGPAASTVSIVVGVLFLISGVGNSLLLGTSMNMLAFRLPNVFFSLGIGAALLILGSYGRISGRLPPDSPYSEEVPADTSQDDAGELAERNHSGAAAADLADAERADALHRATPEQVRRLAVVRRHRSADDRRRAWQGSARRLRRGERG